MGFEADVHSGRESVGHGCLRRGVRFVGRNHRGAALAERLHELSRECTEATELSHYDAQFAERSGGCCERLEFTDGSDTRSVPGLPGEYLEGHHRGVAADAVDVQPAVVLEVFHGPCCRWAQDPVDTTGIEADPGQRRLQLGDVVASQIGRHEHEQPVAECPGRFDDRAPGVFVAVAGDPEATLILEPLDGRLGDSAKKGRLGTDGREPGGPEAALQVADGVAPLPWGQWEVARNSSSSSSRAPLPLAPTIFFLTSPSCRTSRVGMLMTL